MDLMGPVHRFDDYQQKRKWLALPVAVVKKFGDDQGGNLASLVAWYGFFSLFPLLLVFATILGYVLAGDPSTRAVGGARCAEPVPGDRQLVAAEVDLRLGFRARDRRAHGAVGRSRRDDRLADGARHGVGGALQEPTELHQVPLTRPRPAGLPGRPVPRLHHRLRSGERRLRRSPGQGCRLPRLARSQLRAVLRRLPPDERQLHPGPGSALGLGGGRGAVDDPPVGRRPVPQARGWPRLRGLRDRHPAAHLAAAWHSGLPLLRRGQCRCQPAAVAAQLLWSARRARGQTDPARAGQGGGALRPPAHRRRIPKPAPGHRARDPAAP